MLQKKNMTSGHSTNWMVLKVFFFGGGGWRYPFPEKKCYLSYISKKVLSYIYIYTYHIVSADYFSAHQAKKCTDTCGILAPYVGASMGIQSPALWMTTSLVPVQLAIPSSWSSVSRNSSRDMPEAEPQRIGGLVYIGRLTGVIVDMYIVLYCIYIL